MGRRIEKEELITLVPHKGKMFLIDRIIDYDTSAWKIQSETVAREDCLFFDRKLDGIPNYVLFELAAQSISALIGIRLKELSLPPRMGFILSVAGFSFNTPLLKSGDSITISAERTAEMDNVHSFVAEISINGKACGGGKLTVLET